MFGQQSVEFHRLAVRLTQPEQLVLVLRPLLGRIGVNLYLFGCGAAANFSGEL